MRDVGGEVRPVGQHHQQQTARLDDVEREARRQVAGLGSRDRG